MSARVHVRPEFVRDFDRHREYLVREDRLDWLERLYAALERVATLLAEFPAARAPLRRSDRYDSTVANATASRPRICVAQRRSGGYVLREWPLAGDLPYLVQYVHRTEDPIRDVWLARLWHEGQERQAPHLTRWPWRP